jgi:shikimate kinase
VEENRKCMMEDAFVVALKADSRTIINRVSRDRNRPLLKGNVRQKVHQLLAQRKNAYDFAHIQIDTSSSSIDDIVDQIIKQYEINENKN